MFEGFLKMCRGEFKFDEQFDKITSSLREDLCRFMIFCSVLFRMRSVSDKSCRGKKTHFMFSTFSPNITHFMS